MDAALHLLETKGVKGFGQVQVARAAGLQQGHLTYYFPLKRDLVTAVIARLSERAQQELARATEGRAALDPAAAEALLYEVVRTLLRDRRRSRVLVAMLAEAGEDAEVRAALAAMVAEQRRVVAALLGRDPGDPDVLVAVATLRGLGLEQLVEPVDDARIEAAITLFRRWFGAPR